MPDTKKQENGQRKTSGSKPKTDSKTDVKIEDKKTTKSLGKDVKKTLDKNSNKPANVKHGAKVMKQAEDKTKSFKSNKEQQNQKLSTEDCSKMSSPEDMTAEFLEMDREQHADSGNLKNAPRGDVQSKCSTIVTTSKATVATGPLVKTKNERCVNLDPTPTAYTLLDGALKDNISKDGHKEVCVSPEEKTLELSSPRSGPNSAGHTPYHLSPEET